MRRVRAQRLSILVEPDAIGITPTHPDAERRLRRAAAEQVRRAYNDVGDAEWEAFMAWL